jgi:hypothetical protein
MKTITPSHNAHPTWPTREDYWNYRRYHLDAGFDLTRANQIANEWLKRCGTSYAKLINQPASV